MYFQEWALLYNGLSYCLECQAVPVSPLLILLAANATRKVTENSPSIWVPAIHQGDQHEVLGS